uniref:Uncharacterized protein n=1 Tax=Solanum lycopersicum TaxID=4081 RepID=K4CSV7_SOLLC
MVHEPLDTFLRPLDLSQQVHRKITNTMNQESPSKTVNDRYESKPHKWSHTSKKTNQKQNPQGQHTNIEEEECPLGKSTSFNPVQNPININDNVNHVHDNATGQCDVVIIE